MRRVSANAGDAAGAEVKIRAAREPDKGYRHVHHAEENVAAAYTLLGKPRQALGRPQAAADDRSPCYPLFESDPNFVGIRPSSRFTAFPPPHEQQWETFERP